ncbi:MAG: CPBP family intramembrane metalloprotease [Candidatus Bathyarchaeota archaeon]
MFRVRSFGFTLVALVFSIIFHAVWITFNFNLGGVLVQSSGGLEGYEVYPTFSFPLVLILYFLFLLLGAYVGEVAFRGYIQSRVDYGGRKVVGVIVASLLFSVQSINLFQPDQILFFLQTEFIYLMCFSIFVGYFFIKTRGDIWGVSAFHALTRIIDASLPVKITYVFPFFRQIVTITSFVFLILILRLVPFTELMRPENAKRETP